MKRSLILIMSLVLSLVPCSQGFGEEGGVQAGASQETEDDFSTMDNFLTESEALGLEDVFETSVFDESPQKPLEMIEISTVEDLFAMGEKLDGYYLLMADLDLGGQEWTPIGTFVPQKEEGSDSRQPDPAFCFTGTLEGNGHTISNFVINQQEGSCAGLFGCIRDGAITDLTVKKATIQGTGMTGAVVGYSYNAYFYQVNAKKVTIQGEVLEEKEEGEASKGQEGFGGLVGASVDSYLEECISSAKVCIPDGCGNAGILGGTLENTSLYFCKATGSLIAGDDCFCLGGLSGRCIGAEDYSGCIVKEVTLKSGKGAKQVGAITGFLGEALEEGEGSSATAFDSCRVKEVTFDLGEGSEEPKKGKSKD